MLLSAYIRALAADRTRASEPLPGFVLVHRGSEIGIVERVEHGSDATAHVVQARGGLSGSLEYVLPLAALAHVAEDERRAFVDDSVVFEPVTVGSEGRVRLEARRHECGTSELQPPASHGLDPHCRGFRVFADDGLLGEVEAALCASRTDVPEYFVVRVRGRLRNRFPVIAAGRVVDIHPHEQIVFVAGPRRALARLSEHPPLVS
jgi:hypothetical protein